VRSRADPDALGARAGAEATVLAVPPDWSFPDSSWLDADPQFWTEQAER
jgi:hypothetical protein